MAPADARDLAEPGPGPNTVALRRRTSTSSSSSSRRMSARSRHASRTLPRDQDAEYADDCDDQPYGTRTTSTTGTGASLVAPDSSGGSMSSMSASGSAGWSPGGSRGGRGDDGPDEKMTPDSQSRGLPADELVDLQPGSAVVEAEKTVHGRALDGSYMDRADSGSGSRTPARDADAASSYDGSLSSWAPVNARAHRPLGAPPLPVSELTSANLALLNDRIPIPKGKDEWLRFIKEYLASEIRHHSQLFHLDEGKSRTFQAAPTETGRELPSNELLAQNTGPESPIRPLADAAKVKDEQDARLSAEIKTPDAGVSDAPAQPMSPTDPDETEAQFHDRLREYHPAHYEADDMEPFEHETQSQLGAELDEEEEARLSGLPGAIPSNGDKWARQPVAPGEMESNQDPSVPNIPDATNQRSRREFAAYKVEQQEQRQSRRDSTTDRPGDAELRAAEKVRADVQGRQELARGLGQIKSPTVRSSDLTADDRRQMAAGLDDRGRQHIEQVNESVAKLQDLRLEESDDGARPNALSASRDSSASPTTLQAQSETTPKLADSVPSDETPNVGAAADADELTADDAPTIGGGGVGPESRAKREHASMLDGNTATVRQDFSAGGRSALGTIDSRSWNVSTAGVGATVEDEAQRIQVFYERNGYMNAPKPSFESLRRRQRALRRLGLDRPDLPIHRPTLDRFTRLACSIFRTQMSTVTIVGHDKQLFPAQVGLGVESMDLDLGFCTHTSLSSAPCMIVEDAATDWRFRNHPMVKQGRGPIRFYAGCPLVFGVGRRSATVGTLCVIDNKPRHDFDEHAQQVLSDLSGCVVNEMELLYQEMNQQAQRKMHQVTVNFLRRSLEVIVPRPVASKKPISKGSKGGSVASTADDSLSLFNEACQVMRDTLEASAVAIVDLSQFHIFWPSHQSEVEGEGVQSSGDTSSRTGTSSSGAESGEGDDPANPYRKSHDRKQARPLINTSSRQVPNVQFVPRRRRSDPTDTQSSKVKASEIPMLGLAVGSESSRFNFQSPEAKRIICEFIALNLGQRRVWYERDESQAIAASISVLMPKGTQVSLALPVFDFHGQASFCVTACWNDELYSYDNSVIAFVENICGTLQAGSLRHRLSALERSQRAFAALTNHEIRTPMHQILSTANLMRTALLETTPTGSTSSKAATDRMIVSPEKRTEIDMLCKTLETSGHTLQSILNDVLDYLDVGGEHGGGGKAEKGEESVMSEDANGLAMETLLSGAMLEAYRDEARARAVAERDLSKVEVMLEIVPRSSGGWTLAREANALKRAIYKLCLNALQATETGFVKVICEDVSRHTQVPAGYNATMPSAIIAIRIYDTGKGMSKEFCEHEVFKPFTKEDPFSPGSGLGVTLAQRMVDLMGGRMTLTSEKGKGTLALVEVPLVFQGNLSSDEDDDDDDQAVSDTESEVTTRTICLLGFGGSEDHNGLVEVRKCLKRQLVRLKCKLTNHVAQAGLLIVEGGYDLLKHHPDIASRNGDDLRVIYLCAARVVPVSRRNRPHVLADTDIPVEYFHRPLLPSTVTQMVVDKDNEILPSPQHSRQPSLSGSPEPTPELPLHLMTPKEPHLSTTSPAVERGDDFRAQGSGGGDVELRPAPTGRNRHQSFESDGESLGKESLGKDSATESVPEYKVLVVEDNLVNRKLLAGTLRKMGIQCAEAVDGVEGVAEYRKLRPSLVLLDINMPRKDGFETAADIRAYELKRNLPRSRIVAVTALSGESNRRRGLIDSDIDEWLTKPVTIRNLRQDIEKLREKATAEHPTPTAGKSGE